MKGLRHLTVLAALSLLCTGCWPARVTSSPAARGVVLDAKTHAAVCGARVVMSRSVSEYSWSPVTLAEALTNTRPPLVITGTNGGFSIPRAHQWMLMCPMGQSLTLGTLVIQKQGYEPAVIGVDDLGNGDKQPQRFFLTPIQK
jgi:hypothetical protein